MKQRGRKSGRSVVSLSDIAAVRRPDPPAELRGEQREEWRSIVGAMPAEWFRRESHPLLMQYCRQVCRARHLAQLIDEAERADPFDVKDWRELVRDESALATSLSNLATRMRLAQSSTYSKDKARGVTIEQPWGRVA
jgi:hypothetical protein